jgi:hypothetical protein
VTVSTLVTRVEASGDGVATSFSFSPMVIDAPSNLVVEHLDVDGVATLLVRDVHFTVSSAASVELDQLGVTSNTHWE